MAKLIDLSGQVFDRLTVVQRASPYGRRSAWSCKCDCGNETVVRTEHLRGKRVRSCGCLKIEMVTNLKLNHSHARVGQNSPEFRAWCMAKNRCNNPKSDHYQYYGGRGISMCPEWLNDFAAFLDHIGLKPSPELSLDRINVNGDYEPGNVRWATAKVQRLNQRRMAA